ncbi:hypothetical protein BGZ94_008760 [Podila epigama]|nr:hypothetical protein BGZ94_008760 [Podila epigama]
MSFFLPNKLNPQGQRLLTIIISLPIFVSTSYILYKRVVLEEDARKAPIVRNQTLGSNPNDLFAAHQHRTGSQNPTDSASTTSSSSSSSS